MPTSTRSNRRVQPLKPKPKGIAGKVLLCVLLITLTGLLIRNYDDINGYVNRPVTGLALESSLLEVSKGDLNSLLGEFVGQGFFSLDVNAAQEKLRSHPWVADAEVNRVWPNQISVKIVEEVGIARWGDRGLINQYGEMFAPGQRGGRDSLPLLRGPENSQVLVMDQYQRLNQLMSEKGLRIAELELSQRGSWQMLLSDGVRVMVGRDDVQDRVRRLATFYERLPAALVDSDAQLVRSDSPRAAMAIDTIDLRYNNGISVKPSEAALTGVAAR